MAVWLSRRKVKKVLNCLAELPAGKEGAGRGLDYSVPESVGLCLPAGGVKEGEGHAPILRPLLVRLLAGRNSA